METKLIRGNCLEVLQHIDMHNAIIVTDPPFNIGYHYDTYTDRMPEGEYYAMLAKIVGGVPSVIIHYPESLHKLSIYLNEAPQRVVSWVYNSNTAKQHRDIGFYGFMPNFKQVAQPYKNPNDKRIKERIARGLLGAKLYDWWNVNQVKNVSKDKTAHPCQMPLKVMENIIGILPKGVTVIDPFMGSGTTGVACKKYDMNFVGIEQDENYFKIAQERMEKEA